MEFTKECANILKETNKAVIEHDIKLKQLCKTLDNMDKKLDKLNDKFDDKLDKVKNKMDDNVKTYISKKLFLSINGIIIFLLISLFAYTSTIDKQVTKNTVCIEKMEIK